MRYSLSGKVPYENLAWSGNYALLHDRDAIIDTIDLAFGLHQLGGDTILFLPVRSGSDGAGGTVQSITEHVLFDGVQRTLLGNLVPHFNGGFSSPAVLDTLLYYWGLELGQDDARVLLMRYDFRTRALDSIPVQIEVEGSDDRFYFRPPYREGKDMIFETHSFKARVDSTWTQDPRARHLRSSDRGTAS